MSYIFLLIKILFLFLVLINLISLHCTWLKIVVLKMTQKQTFFPPFVFSRPLRSKASSCLLHTDPRSRYLVRLPAKLPGMHYSADEQCQILFGTNATFCTNMEVGGKARPLSFYSDFLFIRLPLQDLAAAQQSENDRGVTKLSITFTQPASQFITRDFASFWFCLFRYAWSIQLKDRTLGKSVFFNTANFHSMANFTFVSKCFSLPNLLYTISLPAMQPFSQSAVREKSQKIYKIKFRASSMSLLSRRTWIAVVEHLKDYTIEQKVASSKHRTTKNLQRSTDQLSPLL